jgi:hypothetical protein
VLSGQWGPDVPSSVAEKLNELYETTGAFPQDPQLRYVANFVGEVQDACGVKASTCPEIPAPVETLCNAVCTNPIVRTDDPYWSYWPASDGMWTHNPIAHFAIDLHLLPQGMVDAGIAETAANAAPPVIQTTLPARPTANGAAAEAAAAASHSASNPVTASAAVPQVDTRVAAAASPEEPTPSPRAGTVSPLRDLPIGARAGAAAARGAHAAPEPPIAAHSEDGGTASAPATETRGAPAAVASTAATAANAPATHGFDSCVVDGKPVTVFVQIYDEVMRSQVDKARQLIDSSYVRFAGIENVVRTAASRGTKIAAQWRQPTLIMHRPEDVDCARAVAHGLAGFVTGLYRPGSDPQIRVRGLPPSFKSDRHVLELWLPAEEPLAAK